MEQDINWNGLQSCVMHNWLGHSRTSVTMYLPQPVKNLFPRSWHCPGKEMHQ